jgi:hypothetical protein
MILAAEGIHPMSKADDIYADDGCEAVFALEASLAKSTGGDPASVRTGLESLGSTYTSTAALGRTLLSPQQHDGVDQVRRFAFSSSCACFTYDGPVYTP